MSAAHVVTLGSLAITAALVAAIAPWAGDDVLGDDVAPWLLVAAVPVILYAAALRVLLQALSRFVAMGVATIVQPLVMLALVAADYAFGDPSPSRRRGVLDHLERRHRRDRARVPRRRAASTWRRSCGRAWRRAAQARRASACRAKPATCCN